MAAASPKRTLTSTLRTTITTETSSIRRSSAAFSSLNIGVEKPAIVLQVRGRGGEGPCESARENEREERREREREEREWW